MEYILPIVVVLGVYHSIRIYLAGRAARKQYRAVAYRSHSVPTTDPWRWRKPVEEVGLTVEDDAETSAIRFDPAFNTSDYLFAVFGCVALAGGAFALLFGLYLFAFAGPEEHFRAHAGFVLAGMGGVFGWAALSVRPRAVRFTRTPEALWVESTCGVFFRRRRRYPPGRPVVVRVREQSVTDYEVEQDAPFYLLRLRKAGFFSLFAAQFYLHANPTQMSWLEGGLCAWFAPPGEEAETNDAPRENSETPPA